MHDIRILAIPNGEFSPFKHGNGFKPYQDSPHVWVLQVRMVDREEVTDWMPVPVVTLPKEQG